MAQRITVLFGDQLDVSVAGAGLAKDTSDNLKANVDNSSLEVSSGNAIQVKALGITNDMLAGSIADGKLAEDYIQTSEVDGSSLEFTSGNVLQIKNDGVTAAKINADVAGAGLTQAVSGALDVNVDNSSLEITSADVLQIKAGGVTDAMLAEDYVKVSEIDGVTLEVTSAGIVQVKDEGITEAKLDMYNSPSVGNVLKYTSNGMEWSSDSGLIATNFVFHEIPSGAINSLNTSYTIANSPVSGTVQVFLNGLLQAPGSGLDYTISGTTIAFAKAPRTNSELYVHYIK